MDKHFPDPEEQVVEQPETSTPETPQQDFAPAGPGSALSSYAQVQGEAASAAPTPVIPLAESTQQKHFKILRDKAERIEKERDEALRKLQELTAPQPEDDFDIKLGNDEIAEGKHLREIAKELKSVKKQLAQYTSQTAALSVETRLKQQYPDIEQVVTAESIEKLREADPEFAEMVSSSTNQYAKAAQVYKKIKELGLAGAPTYAAEQAQAQKNFNKPRPLASISPQQGDSPLSNANAFANGLTDELKAQLNKEMIDSMRYR